MSDLPQPVLHVSRHGVRVLACPTCGAASASVDDYATHYEHAHPESQVNRG